MQDETRSRKRWTRNRPKLATRIKCILPLCSFAVERAYRSHKVRRWQTIYARYSRIATSSHSQIQWTRSNDTENSSAHRHPTSMVAYGAQNQHFLLLNLAERLQQRGAWAKSAWKKKSEIFIDEVFFFVWCEFIHEQSEITRKRFVTPSVCAPPQKRNFGWHLYRCRWWADVKKSQNIVISTANYFNRSISNYDWFRYRLTAANWNRRTM